MTKWNFEKVKNLWMIHKKMPKYFSLIINSQVNNGYLHACIPHLYLLRVNKLK